MLLTFISCDTKTKQSDLFPSKEIVSRQMDSILEKSDLRGLVAIAINREGEKIEYTYGEAIWNTKTPIKTNSIFRIASMTKLVTSVAVMQLVEKDSIGLDEDLAYILPEMASIPILKDEKGLIEGKDPITLRHLLTHTSGFGYFFTDSLLASFNATDWNYDDLPRRFESGTQFLYGTSLDWVGKLVEKISGLSLEEYFRKNITGPLNMSRTWFNVPDSLHNEIVTCGIRGNDGTGILTEITHPYPTVKKENCNGGSGLFSSPEDYSKLLTCLLHDGIYPNGKLLQKETVDEIFKEQLDDISMNIEENYYQPGVCCNFEGLIRPNSNWGLAGLIDSDMTSYGRKEGTLLWGGIYNTYWYIDRESGVVATIFTQYLPFNHSATTLVFNKFSEIIYTNY